MPVKYQTVRLLYFPNLVWDSQVFNKLVFRRSEDHINCVKTILKRRQTVKSFWFFCGKHRFVV